MNEQIIVCEAGLLWRHVLRRLEARVNELLRVGWRVDCWDQDGFIRRAYIVRLSRERKGT
jgi:hypothetical protein